MKRFRHRPMRSRFAILAMVGLLWSQMVLAGHPLCSMAAMAISEMAVAIAGAEEICHHEETLAADDALCAAHCSRDDQTNDVARIPVIPALPPTASIAISSFVFRPADPAPHSGLPLPVSWHRHTAHPTALLLI